MSHLHSLHPPIIHRDLSPSNILLHLDNNGNVYEALLSDFGIARGKDEKGLQLLSPVGHPRYRAPEVSKKQPYSKKVDVVCYLYLRYCYISIYCCFCCWLLLRLMLLLLLLLSSLVFCSIVLDLACTRCFPATDCSMR